MASADISQVQRFEVPQLVGAIEITIGNSGRRGNIAIVRCYSTTFQMRAWLFATSAIALIAIGALFTVTAGAWPILLFCMLQALLLGHVWAELEMHADDREFVRVDDDSIQVDTVWRKCARQCRLQRYWARAVWAEDTQRLSLRSHGREVEIAAGARKEDKLALYEHLGRLIGTARAAS